MNTLIILGSGMPCRRGAISFFVCFCEYMKSVFKSTKSSEKKLRFYPKEKWSSMTILLLAGHETTVRAGQVPKAALRKLCQRGLRQQRGECLCVCIQYAHVCDNYSFIFLASTPLWASVLPNPVVMRALAPTCEIKFVCGQQQSAMPVTTLG